MEDNPVFLANVRRMLVRYAINYRKNNPQASIERARLAADIVRNPDKYTYLFALALATEPGVTLAATASTLLGGIELIFPAFLEPV